MFDSLEFEDEAENSVSISLHATGALNEKQTRDVMQLDTILRLYKYHIDGMMSWQYILE